MIFRYFTKFSILFFMFGIMTFSCAREEVSQEIIRPVRYTQVYATGGNRIRTFSGVAHAGVESNLSFKVAGTVKNISVEVGDQVKSGQRIAVLDPADYELRVQQAQAALAQADAQARNANAAYDRAMRLYENRNISRSDLDAARAANESAKASVNSMEKQLELAKRQLIYTKLIAPLSGSIAQVTCEANENVQAGQTIVVLTADSEIEVKISIPEVLISQIEERSQVTVKFDAIPEKEYSATVTEVGVSAIGMGTTYPVTVRLDESDPVILPGMAANVSFPFQSIDQRERYMVPLVAVGEDHKGRYVYVVEPIQGEEGYGIAKRKPVKVGEITTDGFEIFEGLSDGDMLVTAGISRIEDGKKVRIIK